MTAIRVSGIVLAGGRSARFGGDKLSAAFGTGTVLTATVEALRPFVDEILVVGGAAAAPATRAVPDDRPFEGPLAGLVAGLSAASGQVAVVVGGDMPLLRPAVLRLLLDEIASQRGTSAAVLAWDLVPEGGQRGGGSQFHPLPMALDRAAGLAAATALVREGRRSLRDLADRLAAAPLPQAAWLALDPERDTILDVDTPADLELALARHRATTGRR